MNLINRHIDELVSLCNQHNVDKMYLFRSATTPNFKEDSDIDFLVKFKTIDINDYFDNYLHFKENLIQLFGRDVDYFDSWSEEDEILLNNGLINSNCKFILSTWLSNKYRTNNYVFSIWKDCFVATKEHFYHVGGKESNRNAVYEAILSNVKLKDSIINSGMKSRIKNEKSQLTSKPKVYNLPEQLTLILEEKQMSAMYIK